jgi:hypothetical protein
VAPVIDRPPPVAASDSAQRMVLASIGPAGAFVVAPASNNQASPPAPGATGFVTGPSSLAVAPVLADVPPVAFVDPAPVVIPPLPHLRPVPPPVRTVLTTPPRTAPAPQGARLPETAERRGSAQWDESRPSESVAVEREPAASQSSSPVPSIIVDNAPPSMPSVVVPPSNSGGDEESLADRRGKGDDDHSGKKDRDSDSREIDKALKNVDRILGALPQTPESTRVATARPTARGAGVSRGPSSTPTPTVIEGVKGVPLPSGDLLFALPDRIIIVPASLIVPAAR